MSGLMSDVDHTNALAAEYVLGTLDSEEREQARALLVADTAFAGKVVQWERRLGELHLMVEPVEPDAKIWARIKSKMPESQSRSNARLPEAHIPEPAPVAIPAAAPSLDAIQATISETAAVLTSEAAAAPASEAASPAWEAGSPASEMSEAPVSEVVEAFGSEPSNVPASEPGVEAMSAAAAETPTPMPEAASAPDVDAAPAPAALESAPPMTGCDPDGDAGCRRRAGLARDSNSGGHRRAGVRPAGRAASSGHGDRSDARGAAEDRRGNATGRRRTPGAATLAGICNPDDARGAGRGRTSRRVEVCPRARAPDAATDRGVAPGGR